MDDDATVDCGCIWKSPRDKTRAIQATLRSFNGNAYCDIRMLELRDGRMVPNGKGITVSAKQLGRFAKLVGDAYRKAEKMHLTGCSS
jgi:hypothetical protein